MTSQIKKALHKIEELSVEKQNEIARLILEELDWEKTLESTQSSLSYLAKEAMEEYTSGLTQERDW